MTGINDVLVGLEIFKRHKLFAVCAESKIITSGYGLNPIKMSKEETVSLIKHGWKWLKDQDCWGIYA